MEAPQRIQPQGLADYLEVMSKAVFQADISWRVVESKWPGIVEALHGFDPERLANLPAPELDALTQDTRVIRNRRKLEGIIHNARTIVELDGGPGGFRGYLRSHPGCDELSKDLRKRFKFLGEMGVYYFLSVVGEEIPPHDEVMQAHGRGA